MVRIVLTIILDFGIPLLMHDPSGNRSSRNHKG
jgi:hypothetical protein